MRILIVDDHEIARRGVRSLLQSRDEFEICGEAVDGRDALEKANQLQPDVVVMDVSMPNMNGLEATQAIRQTLPQTEVLILTQHDASEMIRQAFNAGARGYIIKSDLAEDLVSAIEVVAEHKFYLSTKSWKLPGRSQTSFLDAKEILQRGAALESALRQSEERLRLAQSAADLGIWDRDMRTGAISWSAEMYRLYGLDAANDGITMEEWRSRIHPADSEHAASVIEEAIREHKQFNVEFRVMLPTGETRWLVSKGRAFYDSDDEPVRVLGVNIDITERRLAEQALLESDQRLRSTFEQAAVGMTHTAPDGKMLRVNQSLCEMTGYSREELEAMSLEELVHPVDLASAREEWHRVLEGETALASRERRYRRKDGSAIWVNVSLSLVRDSAGSPKYFITAAQDISPRKRAEQALQESEESLRLASEAANVGVWYWDLAASELVWTDQCKELFGISRSERITYQRFLRAIHAEDRERTDQQVQAAIERGGNYETEFRVVLPDGFVRWILVKGRVWRDGSAKFRDSGSNAEDGKPANFSGVWRVHGVALDVTARKDVEQSLRNAQAKLEAQVEQRTAALRALSSRLMHLQDEERRRIARELHDSIGQYLSAIAFTLDRYIRENSSQGAPSALPDANLGASHELLAECREIVQRCLQETRTLSYLLHPPLLDEMGFASAAKWYVQGFAERSGIEVQLDLAQVERLPGAIETALFRVLQESLTNIHRHSGARQASVRMAIEASGVQLEISDQGHGLPQEVLEHFRSMGAGSGVGLAGMRERVKELGGNMEVQSGGSGTTIHVCIPTQTRACSSSLEAQPAPASLPA